MKFTTLTVTKIARNEFLIELDESTSYSGLIQHSRKWRAHVHSIDDTQTVLSAFPNRDCQRIGTSTRAANRFRSTKIGDLCFTVRWDGGAGRYPGMQDAVEGGYLPPAGCTWDLVPFSFQLDTVYQWALRRSGRSCSSVEQGEG
jgi:hypothetical protein